LKVALQADGKIVGVGGVSAVVVMRLNPDGAFDPSFNTTGWRVFGYGGPLGSSDGHAVAVQPDGKVVVAGSYVGADEDFALARVNPDGRIDAGQPPFTIGSFTASPPA